MSLLRNKKGIELAVNFLVVIILGIAMFSLALGLLYQIVDQTEDIRDKTLDQLDSEISFMACSRSEQVCLQENRLTIERGKVNNLGVKILNVNTAKTYFKMSLNAPTATTLNPDEIYNLPEVPRLIDIDGQKDFTAGMSFQVGKDTMSGQYVYSMTIEECTEPVLNDCTTHTAIYQPYKNDVYKIVVTVP